MERETTEPFNANTTDCAEADNDTGTPRLVVPAVDGKTVRGAIDAEVRDTVYREDDSTVRTRSGPRVMAALRNLAIGALRLAGRADITEASRWTNRRADRPFTILRLTA
jgi:hypothetical protein